MGFAPIVSLWNTVYVLYNRRPGFNKLNYIFSLLVILGLTSFIEFTTGHIFVLLIILIENYIEANKVGQNLDKTKDCCIEGNKIIFLIATALISSILSVENIKIKILLILIIIGIYFIFQYLKNNTTNKENIALTEEYQHYYLVGTILSVLILLWSEYEKVPNIRYIKLYCRK